MFGNIWAYGQFMNLILHAVHAKVAVATRE